MDQLIVKWEDAAAGKKQAVGILTPWQELKRSMLGLEVGVTIVAGRPSAGKTTLEDQVAQAAAQEGLPVYRVTMDSSLESLLALAICRNSGACWGMARNSASTSAMPNNQAQMALRKLFI
jgi:replicative DNA helicase